MPTVDPCNGLISGVAVRPGMPIDAADEWSADAGQIPPDLARPMRL
jgi:hypothetical protein